MNTLHIFDFDDTLIRSDTTVFVHHQDGTETELDAAEFGNYVEQPGDIFDYSSFDDYPANASLIDQVFSELKSSIALDGPGNVVILTARSNPLPVRAFLSDNGIDGIEIITTGSTSPMAKAQYILDRLKNENFDEVRVFEDNTQNIRTIQKVIEPTGIRLKTNRVTAHGVIAEGHRMISVYSPWDFTGI